MASSYPSLRPSGVAEKLWLVHWPLLIALSLLAATGTAVLYAVADGSFQPWAERHALRFLICLGVVLVMAVIRPQVWIKLAYPAYAIALIMLLLVLLAGDEVLGARRWISLGPVTFQPSELMKLALVLALARYYQWLPVSHVSRWQWVAIPAALIAVPVAFTLKQPDLGSSVLFSALGLSLMFLAGVSVWYFVCGGVAAVAALPLIWSNLHDYQRRRVEIFLNPDKDPLGSGYHITQSKIALGSGGVSGKGFMQGTQSHLDFVPEKHTDFIASIIGEEWGFVGLVLLILLYALVLVILMTMARQCRNRFGKLLIAGSAMTFFVYVFINLAMVMGLVPVVGVPLPLVSYGGTSMTTLMLSIGLAMSGYVHGRQPIHRDEIGPFL
jgi:rod shape determining protein RodA